MATLTGPDLVNAVAAGINREAKALADPEVRASRLIVQGQALIADFNRAGRDRWGDVVPAMAERLRAFAAELTRDPEAQAALHRTPEKFGLKPDSILGRAATDPNMGQALTKNFENTIDPPSHSFDMSR